MSDDRSIQAAAQANDCVGEHFFFCKTCLLLAARRPAPEEATKEVFTVYGATHIAHCVKCNRDWYIGVCEKCENPTSLIKVHGEGNFSYHCCDCKWWCSNHKGVINGGYDDEW
jgi:hypothetical protein